MFQYSVKTRFSAAYFFFFFFGREGGGWRINLKIFKSICCSHKQMSLFQISHCIFYTELKTFLLNNMLDVLSNKIYKMNKSKQKPTKIQWVLVCNIYIYTEKIENLKFYVWSIWPSFSLKAHISLSNKKKMEWLLVQSLIKKFKKLVRFYRELAVH